MTPLRSLLVLFALFALPIAARAQQATPDFEHQVLGKTLALHNFSGTVKVHAAWDGHSLAFDEPPYRIFAAVQIEHVKQKDKQIILDGKRTTIALNSKAGKLALTDNISPVSITIDLATEQTPLNGLADELFIPLSKAVAALPDDIGTSVIPVYDPDAKKYIFCNECLKRLVPEKVSQLQVKAGADASPPTLIHAVDPEIPQLTKAVNVEVMVSMTVDASGKPKAIWIIRSAGDLFDLPAAAAVAQYKLTPAKYNGVPYPVRLNVSVNFHIQ